MALEVNIANGKRKVPITRNNKFFGAEDFDLEIIEKVTVQAVIKTDKQLDLDYFYEYEYDLMGLFIIGDCNIYVLFKQEEEIDEIPEHEVIQYC